MEVAALALALEPRALLLVQPTLGGCIGGPDPLAVSGPELSHGAQCSETLQRLQARLCCRVDARQHLCRCLQTRDVETQGPPKRRAQSDLPDFPYPSLAYQKRPPYVHTHAHNTQLSVLPCKINKKAY